MYRACIDMVECVGYASMACSDEAWLRENSRKYTVPPNSTEAAVESVLPMSSTRYRYRNLHT
jgi:hypothetical protein